MQMLLKYKKFCLLIVTLLLSWQVNADKIHDPTKPQLKSLTSQTMSKTNTITGQVEKVSMPAMTLQGIMDRRDTKIAIISDQIYAKGDKINGYIISQINHDNVVLVNSETQRRLYIYE